MTVRTREQAAKAAEGIHRFAVGYCQIFTRECFGLPHGVGDVDGDGDADAVDGWLSEPASARHPGDRNPPRGVPVAFSGGSKGYGHRAVSLGGGKIRSTDMGSLGKWNPGLVSTVTIGQIEAAMGVRYTGWTDTINGLPIPGAPKPPPPPAPVPASEVGPFVTFNMYQGNKRPARNIGALLTRTRPVGAVLQEANNYAGTPRGYHRIDVTDDPTPRVASGTPQRDLLANVVLLRDDATIHQVEARQVPGGGWEWNGKPRAARVWIRVVYSLADGIRRELWGIHRCPGGPQPGIVGNRAAWAAEDEFLVQWVTRVLEHNPGRHIEIGGDHNAWVTKMPGHPKSIRSLARRLGARLNLRHIDGFFSINAPDGGTLPRRKRPVIVERFLATLCKLASKFGSDHHRPVLLRYTAQPPPRTK